MYDKVQKAWKSELASREAQFASAPEEARAGLTERLADQREVLKGGHATGYDPAPLTAKRPAFDRRRPRSLRCAHKLQS